MRADEHLYYEELAARLAGGFLSDEECRELHSHLKACGECSMAATEFGDVFRLGLPLTENPMRLFLDRMKFRPTDGARERFLLRAEREGIVLSPSIERRFGNKFNRFGVVAATACVTAAVTAVVVASFYRTPLQLDSRAGDSVSEPPADRSASQGKL